MDKASIALTCLVALLAGCDTLDPLPTDAGPRPDAEPLVVPYDARVSCTRSLHGNPPQVLARPGERFPVYWRVAGSGTEQIEFGSVAVEVNWNGNGWEREDSAAFGRIGRVFDVDAGTFRSLDAEGDFRIQVPGADVDETEHAIRCVIVSTNPPDQRPSNDVDTTEGYDDSDLSILVRHPL